MPLERRLMNKQVRQSEIVQSVIDSSGTVVPVIYLGSVLGLSQQCIYIVVVLSFKVQNLCAITVCHDSF